MTQYAEPKRSRLIARSRLLHLPLSERVEEQPLPELPAQDRPPARDRPLPELPAQDQLLLELPVQRLLVQDRPLPELPVRDRLPVQEQSLPVQVGQVEEASQRPMRPTWAFDNGGAERLGAIVINPNPIMPAASKIIPRAVMIPAVTTPDTARTTMTSPATPMIRNAQSTDDGVDLLTTVTLSPGMRR